MLHCACFITPFIYFRGVRRRVSTRSSLIWSFPKSISHPTRRDLYDGLAKIWGLAWIVLTFWLEVGFIPMSEAIPSGHCRESWGRFCPWLSSWLLICWMPSNAYFTASVSYPEYLILDLLSSGTSYDELISMFLRSSSRCWTSILMRAKPIYESQIGTMVTFWNVFAEHGFRTWWTDWLSNQGCSNLSVLSTSFVGTRVLAVACLGWRV